MRRTNNNPIIIIEDDVDDQEMIKEVFDSLQYQNEVMFFGDGKKRWPS